MEDAPTNALRPTEWDDYIGQERIKHQLQVRAQASIAREEPLDHFLFDGPPGAGKTTLAQILANYVGDEFESYARPVTPRTLANVVRYHQGVVLLDEIHRYTKNDQHNLLTLVEDGYMELPNGRRFQTDWLVIVGATTEPHLLITPLRDRFLPLRWDPYTEQEMTLIVLGMADRLNTDLPEQAAAQLAAASMGVPRQAGHLVKAYADLALANGRSPSVDEVLTFLRIDRDGLTEQHVTYLTTLREMGCVKGEKTLATVLQVEPRELRHIETVLVKRGFLMYGDAGRELTRSGMKRSQGNLMST